MALFNSYKREALVHKKMQRFYYNYKTLKYYSVARETNCECVRKCSDFFFCLSFHLYTIYYT